MKIRFVAGFGDNPCDVPESVKWAMVLHMRLLYDDYKPDDIPVVFKNIQARLKLI